MLVLSQLYDVLTDEVLERSLQTLRNRLDGPPTTVVYFTNNRSHLRFDSYLYLGATRQRKVKSYAELRSLADSEQHDDEDPVITAEPKRPLGGRV